VGVVSTSVLGPLSDSGEEDGQQHESGTCAEDEVPKAADLLEAVVRGDADPPVGDDVPVAQGGLGRRSRP